MTFSFLFNTNLITEKESYQICEEQVDTNDICSSYLKINFAQIQKERANCPLIKIY
jgi:hypothetical protein